MIIAALTAILGEKNIITNKDSSFKPYVVRDINDNK